MHAKGNVFHHQYEIQIIKQAQIQVKLFINVFLTDVHI